MQAGAPLIVGGRLPADPAGRRVGEPDLLVAATGSPGYRPVDVKHHRCLDAGPDGLPALLFAAGPPGLGGGAASAGLSARKRKDDLLQLAHYQRMLEACGMAAPGGAWAASSASRASSPGTTWMPPSGRRRRRQAGRSGARRWRCTTSSSGSASTSSRSPPSTRPIPSVPLLVVPVRISECAECPWWSWCGPQLEAGSGDVEPAAASWLAGVAHPPRPRRHQPGGARLPRPPHRHPRRGPGGPAADHGRAGRPARRHAGHGRRREPEAGAAGPPVPRRASARWATRGR